MTTTLTTSWLPWVCLAMVALLWVSCMLQPRYLHDLLNNGFSAFTTNAAEQVPSIGAQITQWLFNIIVPAICIYTLVTQSAVYGSRLFGIIILLSLLSDVFRAMTALLLQYTFHFGKLASLGYMRYFSLRALFTFIEFAITLLLTSTMVQLPWLIILGVMTIIYLIMLGLQLARLFCDSVLDILGLLAYLITAELLPTVLLYEAGKQLYLAQPV